MRSLSFAEVFMAAFLQNSVLVYDVGGSHVSAAVCLESSWRLGPVIRAPHPACPSSETFIDLLHTLGIEASAGFSAISGAELAMPGPFDFAAGISLMRHKMPFLYGINLRRALALRFGWLPGQVRFLNDADAFLLGEIGAGAARCVPRAVGITLGTGIGSAFAVDGRVVTEGCGIPHGGEIWNIPYEAGIVEDFLSTRAIQRYYTQGNGGNPDVAALAATAPRDPVVAQAFAVFGRHLGLALRMILVDFAPDLVVLGGGISRSAHLFLPAAHTELKDMSFKLQVSGLMDDAPLVGAAVAWFNGCSGSQIANETAEPTAAGAEHADAI
jgi:glucokinase